MAKLTLLALEEPFFAFLNFIPNMIALLQRFHCPGSTTVDIIIYSAAHDMLVPTKSAYILANMTRKYNFSRRPHNSNMHYDLGVLSSKASEKDYFCIISDGNEDIINQKNMLFVSRKHVEAVSILEKEILDALTLRQETIGQR
jgi:hypothetical protein